MSLHYLDESREPRECGRCAGSGTSIEFSPAFDKIQCALCNGSGRLGVEGAKPALRVEVFGPLRGVGTYGYRICESLADGHFRIIKEMRHYFPTEAAALSAARKAQ